MSLAEPIEQSGNKKVDDDEDVRVLAVRGRKITTTTISTIPTGGKLSTTSMKITLPEGEKDINWDYWLIKDKLPLEWESQFFFGTLKRVGDTTWGLVSFDGYSIK